MLEMEYEDIMSCAVVIYHGFLQNLRFLRIIDTFRMGGIGKGVEVCSFPQRWKERGGKENDGGRNAKGEGRESRWWKNGGLSLQVQEQCRDDDHLGLPWKVLNSYRLFRDEGCNIISSSCCLVYRLTIFRDEGCSFISLIASVCESWFTFYWVLIINGRWNPVSYKTFPERLLDRFKELPAVDIFITTADPILEPPIITANTVISLLVVEYRTNNRLACYVSDDGGSPITYHAIREASKFAKVWVLFCKKYSVQVRVPFVYFSTELKPAATLSKEFVQERKDMKREYQELGSKVEGAAKNNGPYKSNEGRIFGEGVSPTQQTEEYVHLVFTAAFITGVFQTIMGVFRLGILVDFLSRSTITGFMGGTAILIMLQQLKGMLGMTHFTSNTDVVSVLHSVFHYHTDWKWQSAVMGIIFLGILLYTRYLKTAKPRLFWISAIAPLLLVIFGGLFTFLVHGETHGIPIVGNLNRGLNPISIGQLQFNSKHFGLVFKAGVMAGFIALAEGIAVGRSLAQPNDQVDGNKEMIAYGLMNIAGSFTSCYLTTGPFSKSAVNAHSGSKSQMSNLVQVS